ncbi:MAG: TldD/PmbA family protein, partial [Planctomycetes bacterium]|nr:TldD/PmbA family protein [Planctomycetota bacterium]
MSVHDRGRNTQYGLRNTNHGSDSETLEKAIQSALEAASADYAEIRIQEGRTTRVAYTGKELEDIGESTDLGGSVRALVKGAWGFAAFNDIAELSRYVRMACDQARLIGGGDARLAPVPPSRDRAVLAEGVDPSTVPLADKRELCARYNDLILAAPKVQTSSVRYRDSHSATYFASSEGHYIVQEVVFCGVIMVAVAKDGADVQQAFHSVGDLRGYGNVQGLDGQCEEIAKRAGDLLSAKSVEGGKYTVIIDPRLCGVFAHEAFGHLSEADFVYENKKL